MSEAGLELDGWQQDVLIDGMALGVDAEAAPVADSASDQRKRVYATPSRTAPTTRWAADEVVILVPRQNGKTLNLVARALWGPTLGGEKLVVWTSHEFKSAREAFLLCKSLCDTPAFERFEPKVRVSNGKESIEFAGGNRLLFIARSRTSGRGFSPDCVILDEAFELDDLALSALKPSLSAAKAPQLWYASSAPHDTSHVLRRLAVKGRGSDARRTVYLEWCAPDAAAAADVDAWSVANPGIGHRIDPAFIESELESLEPRDFERERLGRWDEEVGGAWIPAEAWTACVRPAEREAGAQTVLGLAGSPSGDTAALVSATVSDKPHIQVEGFWDADVDVLVIEERIREVCRSSTSTRIGADPARWSRTLDVLTQEGYPALEWPWTPARSIPACTRFHEAVANGQLSHSGDEELDRHIANAVVKVDARGARISRESRYTTRRIDLAVAGVIAHDMACDLMAHAFKIW